MDHENRMATLMVEANPIERVESLQRLLDAEPLTTEEVEDACRALASEKSATVQALYWELLERTAPSALALDLALNCIMDPAAPNRSEAVRYLRFCFPDRLPGLIEAFRRDPDEDLRYQLSEFLRDSDIEGAVDMKIGMLTNASHARREALTSEIAELGNFRQLEELRRLDRLSGGNSVFAAAAQLLAARIDT